MAKIKSSTRNQHIYSRVKKSCKTKMDAGYKNNRYGNAWRFNVVGYCWYPY